MGRFKTEEFLSQTMTTQVVFNPLFLFTETLLIAKNVEVVSSYSLSASFSQQTSNTESTGKFRRVLKKKKMSSFIVVEFV